MKTKLKFNDIYKEGSLVYTIRHNKIIDVYIESINIRITYNNTSVSYIDKYTGNNYTAIALFETMEEASKYLEPMLKKQSTIDTMEWINTVHGD